MYLGPVVIEFQILFLLSDRMVSMEQQERHLETGRQLPGPNEVDRTADERQPEGNEGIWLLW